MVDGAAMIRRAEPADADPIAALVDRAYAMYLPRMDRRPAPMDADYAELVRTAPVWVAVRGAAVVGVVVCMVADDHLLVENLAVDPAEQGTGIGGRLLELAEAFAVESGRREVRLYTNEVMVENLRFYGRRGYVETSREEQSGFRRVFLAKRLA